MKFSIKRTSEIVLSSLLFLVLMFSLFINPIYAFPTAVEPDIIAPRAVLMDLKTGTILFDKNANEPTFPASTTKILTALLVLENASLNDIVHIDYEPGVTGSSMYIVPGESFSVETLLKALLIRSANDAAEVLARHISGSVDSFVLLMNERAAALGAKNTHFTNPHGLPNESHKTTAYDLAMIAREAMQYDLFREIVASRSLVIPPTGETDQRVYNNSNRFLWGTGPNHQMMYQGLSTDIYYEPVDGIKTGYTNSARNCLVSSANFGDQRFIAVVLNAEQENIYSDSRTLLDYGFQHFHTITLVESGSELTAIPVLNGTEDSLTLYSDSTLSFVVPRSIMADDIKPKLSLIDENITAPIESGTIFGSIDYFYEDNLIGQVSLVNQQQVDFVPVYQRISYRGYLFPAFLLFFLIWQSYVYRLRRKKKRIRRMQARTDRYQQYESYE
ncbi:D-alanyl-D-alanine carboxypeptidase family protein [Anoxynatronum buryatiense]|uniref:serine-type D-Ala-D-Ala carboxypeptidase n=1 Tax=Anoxynatronum buryatiense TaxID=489973 RepID=A0AA45WUS1_9CLOT|nr:D-alanyl-D-alanine carboxypeptidase family protein [Anoxynatronum buryatiense]SMP49540.1 D-alanyl-D-alanine carboxypeptidase (penicillin-binding protein 5/6) [Anoxynatronum buryatiense]